HTYTLSLHDALPICLPLPPRSWAPWLVPCSPVFRATAWAAAAACAGWRYSTWFPRRGALLHGTGAPWCFFASSAAWALADPPFSGPCTSRRFPRPDGAGGWSAAFNSTRSEERRVGKECRSRWALHH